MNFRAVIVFVALMLLKDSFSSPLEKGPIEEEPPMVQDKCPDRQVTLLHNTVNCACDTSEGLLGELAHLRVLCNKWDTKLFEKPCDSYRVNGNVDREALGRSLLEVYQKHFLWNSDDIHFVKTLSRSLDVKISTSFAKAPSPPGFHDCRYHCQCCYLCGIECHGLHCNCNQYYCGLKCPQKSFCPLLLR